jgi:transcription-repair coupling factor (superfamily II helicase)
MLERTVRELKGEEEAQTLTTQLNLALNLRIPNDYVQEENQRLRMYKRIAGVESEEQLGDVRSEMEDRYGPLPAPVRNLLEATTLKLFCQRVGVAAVERKQNIIQVRFTENANIDPAKLAEFVATNKGAQFSPGGILKFVLRSTNAEDVLARIKELLGQLSAEPAPVA